VGRIRPYRKSRQRQQGHKPRGKPKLSSDHCTHCHSYGALVYINIRNDRALAADTFYIIIARTYAGRYELDTHIFSALALDLDHVSIVAYVTEWNVLNTD